MLDTSRTVASIVLDHSETGPVFQRNRIDFCCKGHFSLRDACADRGVDPGVLVAELEDAIARRRGDAERDPRTLSTVALIGHIVSQHHEYLRKALPFIDGLAKKVARVHGDHQPSLRELQSTVAQMIEALMPHLEEEEQVLFPAAMAREPNVEVLRRELESMHKDHLEVGAMLETIRALTCDFTPADWACGSYRALYSELEALEGDVLKHVHLENHVLMPRFAS